MSVNSKMTAIANPIRELMGTTGTMGLDTMANNLKDAVSEVSEQADLIQQVKAALAGKAVGGGGGSGLVIKTGTTTSRTINTGLSDIEAFFIYKETQTATGLIHLSYTKDGGTSRMYASAWSTNNYGSKTITNATGGTTVSGGTFTISATSATSGGLTSNVTYKWVAIGKE